MSKDTNDLNSKQSGMKTDACVNLGRHKAQCSICKHPNCKEIEDAWVGWGYTVQIAREFGVSRDSIYRHARALNLFAKREANDKVICEKVLERVDWTQFTGSNYISILKLHREIRLAEKKAEAERASDAKTLQPDTTQQLDDPIPDGSLANLVEETESAISKEPHSDKDSVKLINAEKAPEAAQSANPKPAVQETMAKAGGNGVLVGIIDKVIGETPDAGPGQGQNEPQDSAPTIQ